MDNLFSCRHPRHLQYTKSPGFAFFLALAGLGAVLYLRKGWAG